jgi:hypothetical protein
MNVTWAWTLQQNTLEVDEKETREAFKIIIGGNTSPSTNGQDGP